MPDNQHQEANVNDDDQRRDQRPESQRIGQSEGQGTAAQRQQAPGSTPDPGPKGELGDENPSQGQKGQPGLNDPNEEEWNPSSGHSER